MSRKRKDLCNEKRDMTHIYRSEEHDKLRDVWAAIERERYSQCLTDRNMTSSRNNHEARA